MLIYFVISNREARFVPRCSFETHKKYYQYA